MIWCFRSGSLALDYDRYSATTRGLNSWYMMYWNMNYDRYSATTLGLNSWYMMYWNMNYDRYSATTLGLNSWYMMYWNMNYDRYSATILGLNSWYMMYWNMKGHHINSWGRVGNGKVITEYMWSGVESRQGRIEGRQLYSQFLKNEEYIQVSATLSDKNLLLIMMFYLKIDLFNGCFSA